MRNLCKRLKNEKKNQISDYKCGEPQLPNAAMNLPNFWYGSCSYGPLSENHTLYAGENSDMAKFWPFKTKIWQCF